CRLSRGQIDDTHVAPEHAGAQSGAQCLGTGFLGGESLGVSIDQLRASFGLGAFCGGEDAIEEAVAVVRDRLFDAADIDDVGTDAEDHARPAFLRPRSMASRINFTASAKPSNTASPIRK